MKKFNCLFNLIIAIGVFVILGAAGSSDTGTMEISEVLVFSVLGAVLIWAGTFGKHILCDKSNREKSSPMCKKSIITVPPCKTDAAA